MRIEEWQLWMHPYPTLVKKRGRRVNPALFPFNREFRDGNALVDLSGLFEERKKTPPQLKMCVRAVALKALEKSEVLDRDAVRAAVSKGFAICTSQLQKNGYLRVGSQSPTKAGKTAGRSKAATKGYDEKFLDYEELLAAARKSKNESKSDQVDPLDREAARRAHSGSQEDL